MTTGVASKYLEQRGFGEKVAIVPPGVDVDLFDWEASPPVYPPRIVLSGRIGPGRGVRLLLEATREILADVPVELWLAGPVEPGFEGVLAEAVKALGLTDAVRCVGPVEHGEIPRLLASATVCVAPHAPDPEERPLAGFPLKILEYLACRKATVAPRRPAVEEIIRDGDQGLLFAPGDPRDLAHKIRVLLTAPRLRDALAEAGYRAVRERWPASRARRSLLELYHQLAPCEPWTPTGGVAGPPTEVPASPETTTARRSLVVSGDLGEDAGGTAADFPGIEETFPDTTRPDLAVRALETELLCDPPVPEK